MKGFPMRAAGDPAAGRPVADIIAGRLGAKTSPLPRMVAIAGVALHLREEVAVGRSFVALLDRAAVTGDRRDAEVEGAVEDLEEVPLALGGVVEARGAS
jgi:hypothetical protein